MATTLFINKHNPHADGRNGPKLAGGVFIIYARCANDGGHSNGPFNVRFTKLGPVPGLSLNWAFNLCREQYTTFDAATAALRTAIAENNWNESNTELTCASRDSGEASG